MFFSLFLFFVSLHTPKRNGNRFDNKMQIDFKSPPPPHDFKCCVVKWSTSRQRFSQQLDALREQIQHEQVDLLIVVDIPRHHAKKLGQQDWTKDYYVSKERRSITEQQRSGGNVEQSQQSSSGPELITVAFCRYPYFSEQWFPLATEATEGSRAAAVAHIVEVCIPLNAWHPDRTPIALLQEYQLTYDEASMLTFVIAPHVTPSGLNGLNETFAPSLVHNTVLFILPTAVEHHHRQPHQQIDCGSPKLNCVIQPRLWRVVGEGVVVSLASTLGSLENDDSE